MRTFKIVQKRLYDALSHRHSVLLCFVGFVLILVSAFHFGETALEWSSEKYQAVFNSYRDNIAQRSFQKLLCQYVPIDAVYTWVNGTDPYLLSELYKTRHKLADELNLTSARDQQCTYNHCVQSHLVLIQPVIPRSTTLDDLEDAYLPFAKVTSIFVIQSTKRERSQNHTVLVFDALESAKMAASQRWFMLKQTNYSMTVAYVTDEWKAPSAVLLNDLFVLSGVPSGHSGDEIQHRLDKEVDKVFLYPEKSMALVSVRNLELSYNFSLKNLTFDRKLLKIFPAYLVLEPLSKEEDASMNRFADNEELRYSLRSLEKNAPWIRHVYLVTNGQIPSWLNLGNPRISIITHEELFPNKTHLPSFSSPAIECHLHRIPGLSEKFIYLNDDVFLGKEVWPEDFYSHSWGHKVYLSWPVPDCAEGCPTSWIRDGYCDRTCNNSGCDWDGGDCTGTNVKFSYPQSQAAVRGSFLYGHQALLDDVDKLYCSPSCANSWLSDRYCDSACNVQACGFDAGDCGTSNFHHLHQIHLKSNGDHYQLPSGVVSAYLNLTISPLGFNNSIQSGSYEDSEVVRVVSVSVKYAILVVVLQHDFGSMNITVYLSAEGKEVTFTLGLDTKTSSATTETETVLNEQMTSVKTTYIPPVNATNYPPAKWFPKTIFYPETENGSDKDWSPPMHDDLWKEGQDFKLLFESGYLTDEGYKKLQNASALDHELIKTPETENIPEEIITEHLDDIKPLSRSRKYFRSLKWISDELLPPYDHNGFMPWEQDDFLHEIHKAEQKRNIESKYRFDVPFRQRHLLDTFGDSLRHVNRIFNSAFGYEARKVPAHMAHLVDVNIMSRLQNRFPEAFDITSSHKIRHAEDMQFAFSYYYYLMSEIEEVSIEDIFDQYDTDGSGSWSEREIRTLLTQLHDLPLQFANLVEFEQALTNCSQNKWTESEAESIPQTSQEKYTDTTLWFVSKSLVAGCDIIKSRILERFGKHKRNKFQILGEEDVVFKMLQSNLSTVLALLDEIRKKPKKFICLNDNIGHGAKDAETIKSVLKDFYDSLFPHPSQFELPAEYRNRFMYMDELERWQKYRLMIRTAAILLLLSLLLSALWALCKLQIFLCQGRRKPLQFKINV